jgi:hypothetical protein
MGPAKTSAVNGRLARLVRPGLGADWNRGGFVLAVGCGLVLLFRGAGLGHQLAFGPFALPGVVLIILLDVLSSH